MEITPRTMYLIRLSLGDLLADRAEARAKENWAECWHKLDKMLASEIYSFLVDCEEFASRYGRVDLLLTPGPLRQLLRILDDV